MIYHIEELCWGEIATAIEFSDSRPFLSYSIQESCLVFDDLTYLTFMAELLLKYSGLARWPGRDFGITSGCCSSN